MEEMDEEDEDKDVGGSNGWFESSPYQPHTYTETSFPYTDTHHIQYMKFNALKSNKLVCNC